MHTSHGRCGALVHGPTSGACLDRSLSSCHSIALRHPELSHAIQDLGPDPNLRPLSDEGARSHLSSKDRLLPVGHILDRSILKTQSRPRSAVSSRFPADSPEFPLQAAVQTPHFPAHPRIPSARDTSFRTIEASTSSSLPSCAIISSIWSRAASDSAIHGTRVQYSDDPEAARSVRATMI